MCRDFLSVEWFGHKTHKRTATLDDKCGKSLKSGQIAVHKIPTLTALLHTD